MREVTNNLKNSPVYLKHSESVWGVAFISLIIDACLLDKFSLNTHLTLLNILACLCVLIALISIERTKLLIIIQSVTTQRESLTRKLSKYSALGIVLIMSCSFLEASFRLYAINPFLIILAAIMCVYAGFSWFKKSKNLTKSSNPETDLEHCNYLIGVIGICAARLLSPIGVIQGAGLTNSIVLFASSAILLSLLQPKAEDFTSHCKRCGKTISSALLSNLKHKKCTNCSRSK